MLAAEPESFQQLSEIFSAPEKESRRAQVDNKALSFNEKWNSLANNFFNAPDFEPENTFTDADSRIIDIDPRLPPLTPWTGERLRKTFRELKTKFAMVDDMFSRSGNVEAGADIDEADRFDGHIKRILHNESPTLHKVMLFSFWVFDKKPPKFISRAKPPQQQFDSSSQAAESADSMYVKPYKRVRVRSETDALAKAVSALAPNEKEQMIRISLLEKQERHQESQEQRDLFDWKRKQLEGFLSISDKLRPETKEKIQQKMSDLADNFLSDNF
jgi:hypothetical protein